MQELRELRPRYVSAAGLSITFRLKIKEITVAFDGRGARFVSQSGFKDLQEGLGISGNELQCVDDPLFSRMTFFYSLFCGGPSSVKGCGLDVDTSRVAANRCLRIIDISVASHKIIRLGADDSALIAPNCNSN